MICRLNLTLPHPVLAHSPCAPSHLRRTSQLSSSSCFPRAFAPPSVLPLSLPLVPLPLICPFPSSISSLRPRHSALTCSRFPCFHLPFPDRIHTAQRAQLVRAGQAECGAGGGLQAHALKLRKDTGTCCDTDKWGGVNPELVSMHQ